MEEITPCSCGNKFMVLLNHMSQDAALVAEPCDPPTASCPGCGAVWQNEEGKWKKVIGSTTLQALRHLSNG